MEYDDRVPWIKTIDPSAAAGLLKKIYDDAIHRAGKVFNVVRVQSLHPRVLRSSMQLYAELMHSPELVLSRPQREMIATVVSRTNDCFY